MCLGVTVNYIHITLVVLPMATTPLCMSSCSQRRVVFCDPLDPFFNSGFDGECFERRRPRVVDEGYRGQGPAAQGRPGCLAQAKGDEVIHECIAQEARLIATSFYCRSVPSLNYIITYHPRA